MIHPDPQGSWKFAHLLVPKGTHKILPSVNTKGFHKWKQRWATQGLGLTQLFPGLVNTTPLPLVTFSIHKKKKKSSFQRVKPQKHYSRSIVWLTL